MIGTLGPVRGIGRLQVRELDSLLLLISWTWYSDTTQTLLGYVYFGTRIVYVHEVFITVVTVITIGKYIVHIFRQMLCCDYRIEVTNSSFYYNTGLFISFSDVHICLFNK